MTTVAASSHQRRSVIGPTIFTAFMVALTLGLGIWQIERRTEKHALIAALDERLAAAPVPLPASSTWATLNPTVDEFRRVTVSVTMAGGQDATVYGSGSAIRTDVSGQGLWIFTPAKLPSGESVVIDRGFVSDAERERYASASKASSNPSVITGYIRFPEKPGWIMPAADHVKRLWFTRDIQDMAQALNWGTVAPFYIDMESPVPETGLPKPGPLKPHLPDDHLQYAITWFGLSAALAIAFIVWLRGRRKSDLSA